MRIRDKAGRWVSFLISIAPIRNQKAAIVGAVETFQSLGLALPRRETRAPIPGEVAIIGQSPPFISVITGNF